MEDQNDFRVFIETDMANGIKKVWVRKDNRMSRANYQFENGTLTVKELKYGCILSEEEGLKPLLEMDERFFDQIFKKIMEALMSHGIKPDAESINEGKLIAMTEHKNDLKEILHKVMTWRS